jgi:phosphoenolpyruvate phosphomutase / 2-hydroxyethylphosphonate cytidylyltransferase
MSKTVYVGIAGDAVSAGHVDVIEEARKHGEVVVGVLSDAALSRFKPLPALSFAQRKRVFENFVGVSRVVTQQEWDFVPNLRQLRPDFLIYGDEWRRGSQHRYHGRAAAALAEWGGRIIELPSNFSGSTSPDRSPGLGVTCGTRRRSLLRLLNIGEMLRVIEVHSPLCGHLVEHLQVELPGRIARFHAMWSSSLADSAIRAKPDTDVVDMSSRMAGIDALFEVTTKPLIFDGNSGGHPEHFAFAVRSLERLGVSAVIVEDKAGLKRNSLLDGAPKQEQESIHKFCEKIVVGRAALISDSFLIICRVESLVLGAGIEDALTRAHAYVAAGADGIMIHSRSNSPDEILQFCDRFRENDPDTRLVAVPSSYSSVREDDLNRRGVNVVIYANHLLRAAYPAMRAAAESILRHGRAKEAEEICMPIRELLSLAPGQ